MSNLTELETDIEILLHNLKLTYKKVSILKDISIQYVIDEFGVIVCCIDRRDYARITDEVQNVYEGWKLVHLTVQEGLTQEKNDDVIWELMRAGYMTWVRRNFPRQFKQLITEHNFGTKIIQKRLKIWNNEPRFKFLIEDNEAALNQSASYILSIDPGFFDSMPPEEEVRVC